MNIGIDIDDTLVDSTKNMIDKIGLYDKSGEVEKHIEEIMSGEIPTENIRKFMNTYLLDLTKTIRVKKDAIEVVNRLKNKGHKIILITSRNDEECKGLEKYTLEYLKKNNLIYDKIFLNSRDKAKVCIENDIDIMIDDSIKHCNNVSSTGIITFLFNSLINKGKKTSLKRVNNWRQLEKEINKIEEKGLYKTIYESPIGRIKIEAEGDSITKVHFISNSEVKENPNKITLECKKQLEEYFEGKRKEFNLKYKLEGTEFQCSVWKELAKIPYGNLTTYKDVAERVGNAQGVRAVANAIGRNNIVIIIPCHRVIGSNGKLTGFSAKTDDKTGLEIKKELLELEDSLCKMKKS